MNRSLRSALLRRILGATCVLFAGVAAILYLLVRQSLWTEFDALLAAKTRALAAMVWQDGDRLVFDFHEHPPQEFQRLTRPEYYAAYDDAGRLLARSRRLGAAEFPRVPGSLVHPGSSACILPDGRAGRMAAVRFVPAPLQSLQTADRIEPRGRDADAPDDLSDDLEEAADQTPRSAVTLVVARDTLEVDAALRNAAGTLLAVFSVAAVLMHVVLKRVVSRQLRPLEAMAAQIRNLQAHSLSERLSLTGVPDELQPVAQRFNELLCRLDDAFTRERAFSADVAHELRTPLTGLRMIMDVALSRARNTDQYQQSFADCRSICDQTQRLVETLLLMARLDAGVDEGRNELVDVALVAGQLWARLRGRAAERNVDVCWTIPGRVLLQTDAQQFRVLLSNLFENAVSYVDRGGGIDIRADSDVDGLVLVVANSGCRLTPEQVEHVFERFWRADASRGETGAHSGLGLALSRRIAERLGASLVADARDGWFTATIRTPRSSLTIMADDDCGWSDGNEPPPDREATNTTVATDPVAVE